MRWSHPRPNRTVSRVPAHLDAARSLLHLLGTAGRGGLDVKDVVAADKDLTEEAGELPVDEFLRLVQSQIHVGIGRGEDALIFLAPLQADTDGLAGQIRQEGLGVDNEL